MATIEDKIILSVQTGEAVTNVGQLKQNIRDLKDRLEDLTIGTDEYQDTLKELKVNQAALKDAMYGTATSMEQITKDANGLSDSYNGLVKQLADLKQEWRAVDQSTEEGRARFQDLTKQIAATNDKLKAMDASVGVYGRNVGNYKSALDGLAGGFTATAGSAGRVITPLKNMNTGLKAMSTTPVIAILGLLANILTKVMENMKTSEDNVKSATQAFSLFSGAADIVKNVMQLLGKAVSSVANVFSNLLEKIFPALRQASELREQITQKEIELTLRHRTAIQDNADAELEVAKLRNAAQDKTNKSAEQRLALLQAAADKEKEISQRNYEAAKLAYDIEVLKSQTSENSAEDNDRLAQAYANMRKAETDYYTGTLRLEKQISNERKTIHDEEIKRQDIRKKAALDSLKSEQRYQQEKADIAVKGSADWLHWQEQAYNTAEKIALKEAEIAKEARERELTELMGKEEAKAIATQEYEQQRLDIVAKYDKARADVAGQWGDFEIEQGRLRQEAKMQQLEEGSLEYIAAEVELKKYELDTLYKMDGESDAAFYARKVKAEQDYLKTKKQLTKQQIALAQQGAAGVSSILGSLADMYENDTDATEEQLRAAKGMRIAGATIDMLSGVVSAISTAQQLGPIAGPIMAAINSAAVIASGIANIMKIKQQDTSKNNTSTATPTSASAATSAPAVIQQVEMTRSLTSATEEARLDRMAEDQRVYLVYDDVEQAGRRVEVQDTEATF